MIISVDHGNKSIKTPNTLFTSGLISSEGPECYAIVHSKHGLRNPSQKWPSHFCE